MSSRNFIDLFVSDAQSAYGAAPTPTVNSVSEGPNSSWSDSLSRWLGRAADVYTAVRGSDSAAAPNPTDNPTARSIAAGQQAAWLPWVIGGAVLLVAALIFFRR